MLTKMTNICDKFHWDRSSKCRDIASRKTVGNGWPEKGRKVGNRNASATYCWPRHWNAAKV